MPSIAHAPSLRPLPAAAADETHRVHRLGLDGREPALLEPTVAERTDRDGRAHRLGDACVVAGELADDRP
jgi:hypothetical protein